MPDAQVLILDATQRLHQLPIDAVQQVLEFITSLEAKLAPFYSNGHTEPALDDPQEQLPDNILELRRELIEEYGDGPVPSDTPFIGGITLGEYYALSDEEQGRLWDEESQIGLVEYEELEVPPHVVPV
ncbi:MAG: hypothetical protein AAF639_29240 [Chloroflexota bacterium]